LKKREEGTKRTRKNLKAPEKAGDSPGSPEVRGLPNIKYGGGKR